MPDLPREPENNPTLSVVAPAHNEEENVRLLVEKVGEALAPTGLEFEFIIVDDASTDATAEVGESLNSEFPWLRVIRLSRPASGGGNGQSAAFKVGFAACRGRIVGVLDADLQNDPRDFVAMLARMDETGADMVQGDRSAARRQGDSIVRQYGSLVGRAFRRWLLGDTIRDTGCSLRLMKREIAVALPLEFKGMHRFIPATARHLGYTVVEMPVGHHPRNAGVPKYGMGITKRALPGLIDLFAVRWMRSRRRTPTVASDSLGRAPEPEARERVVVPSAREREASA